MESDDLLGDVHNRPVANVEHMLAYLPTACKFFAKDDSSLTRGEVLRHTHSYSVAIACRYTVSVEISSVGKANETVMKEGTSSVLKAHTAWTAHIRVQCTSRRFCRPAGSAKLSTGAS